MIDDTSIHYDTHECTTCEDVGVEYCYNCGQWHCDYCMIEVEEMPTCLECVHTR